MENIDFCEKIRKLDLEKFWFSPQNVLFLGETDFFSEKSTFCMTIKRYFPTSSSMYNSHVCKKSQRKKF